MTSMTFCQVWICWGSYVKRINRLWHQKLNLVFIWRYLKYSSDKYASEVCSYRLRGCLYIVDSFTSPVTIILKKMRHRLLFYIRGYTNLNYIWDILESISWAPHSLSCILSGLILYPHHKQVYRFTHLMSIWRQFLLSWQLCTNQFYVSHRRRPTAMRGLLGELAMQVGRSPMSMTASTTPEVTLKSRRLQSYL